MYGMQYANVICICKYKLYKIFGKHLFFVLTQNSFMSFLLTSLIKTKVKFSSYIDNEVLGDGCFLGTSIRAA